MTFYVPPGFWLLRDQEDRESDRDLRDLLASGYYSAFYVNLNGTLGYILPSEWISEQGEAMIKFACYRSFYKGADGRWESPFADDYDESLKRLIVIREVEDEDESVAAPTSPIAKGGRPNKWDWEGAAIHLSAYAQKNDETIPDRPTLNKVVSDFFIGTVGEHPVDGDIRKFVKRFHEQVWPPKT